MYKVTKIIDYKNKKALVLLLDFKSSYLTDNMQNITLIFLYFSDFVALMYKLLHIYPFNIITFFKLIFHLLFSFDLLFWFQCTQTRTLHKRSNFYPSQQNLSLSLTFNFISFLYSLNSFRYGEYIDVTFITMKPMEYPT